MTGAPHFRSYLFIPGNRADWIKRVADLKADAYILDLEDAVADGDKLVARNIVAELIPAVAGTGAAVFVRINPLSTRYWLDDLIAVVQPGLTGLAVPKVQSSGDVLAVEHVVNALEQSAGIPVGKTQLQPLLETAPGIQDAYRILRSSARISSFYGGSARDGDTCRDVGYQWTREGTESLYIRSKLILDGRAAAIASPVGGIWVDIADVDGLELFAEENHRLGYRGFYVIHPSHVETVNRVFSLDDDDAAYYEKVVSAFDDATKLGKGAVLVDGRMIDYAMARRAQEVLAANAPKTPGGETSTKDG